ncbi:MAG: hypothetical protein V2A71_05910 [Candidatus Eisenbacteria bacterium]
MTKILFPFIYHPDRSLAVYGESRKFLHRSGREPDISQLGWTYLDVGDLIPQTMKSFWSGHFFPWLESWEEIQVSCNLCLFGLYKQAMVSLRGGLELGLLSVYWNLNDDGHETVQQWLRSNEDTPRLHEIWSRLVKHDNFKAFGQHYDLQSHLLSFNFLHDYAHTKGFKFSNRLGMLKSNWQTFEERGFNTWFRSFKEVIKVLVVCHLVKYPLGTVRFDYDAKFGIDTPAFGGLKEHQVDRLERLLGPSVFAQIAALVRDDPRAQKVLRWVEALPDMSEDKVEQQIIDMDKRHIEMWGLPKWLEAKHKMIEHRDKTEKWERRVTALTAWAKEQGYDRPGWEREGGPNRGVSDD